MNSTPVLFTLTGTRSCIVLVPLAFYQTKGTNIIQYGSYSFIIYNKRYINDVI
jgi:hypothetical protein